MKFLSKIERNLRVALLVGVITVVAIIASSYCFVTKFYEIPLGFALGGAVVSALYLVGHFLYQIDVKNGEVKYSILMIGIRNFILIGSIIVLGLMYYRWDIKYFNLFAYMASIQVESSSLLLTTLFIKINRKENEQWELS